jgi:hypothetical protein
MVAHAANQDRQSAAPLPLAFLGRTSTLVVQDPVSSLRRQVRSVQEKAPPGSFIAAWFWDIESGALDIEQRGHGSAHERDPARRWPGRPSSRGCLTQPQVCRRDLRGH